MGFSLRGAHSLYGFLWLASLSALAMGAIMSPYEKRPRMFLYNGQLFFHAGEGRNISFTVDKSSGATITFGDLDIQSLPTLGTIQEYKQQLRGYESRQNASHTIITAVLQGQRDLKTALRTAQSQLDLLRTSTTTPSPDAVRERGNLRRQVRRLMTSLAELKRTVSADECASNPCQNAGTCIDAVGKYYCLCLPEFTGPNCADDINECVTLRGSMLTCQNGGTCLNVHGGFQCQCPPQWFGYRCTEKHDDCATAGPFALCGPHGTCVAVQRSVAGAPAYKCLCEIGWISDSVINPRCVDMNECASTNPCYPGVPCINTPGSFRCGTCPPGYTGNGMSCWDIDECARNNGGCSTTPRVQCMNTQGSYVCGPCPPGYRGDGRTCAREASCSSSPCHASADCFEMPESDTGYRCQCRNGLIGNGIGAGGCTASAYNPCRSSPCLNGATCQATSSSAFQCLCRWGYTGPRCATANACLSAPCRNGGTCDYLGIDARNMAGRYVCRCRQGYYGPNCELTEDGCGRHYQNNETGSFKYPVEGQVYQHNHVCTWSITTTQNKVLNITFPTFDIEAGQGGSCKYDNLTLYDGPNSQSPVIGVYCGAKGTARAPDAYVLSSRNQIHAVFMSDRSVVRTGFLANWTTIVPSCGGRKTGDSQGRITSPGYPRPYPEFQHCQWVISNLPGFQYQVTIGSVRLAVEDVNCTGDVIEVRDGQRSDDPILAQVCTSQFTPTTSFLTSMPYIFIYFRSVARQGKPAASGFSLSYSIQQMSRSCGGVLTEDTGTIRTPNFNSGFYYSDLDCIWIVDGRSISAARVQLTFSEFDVQGTRTNSARYSVYRGPSGGLVTSGGRRFFGVVARNTLCRGDYVEIRDGGQETSPLITYLCGNEVPGPIASTGPQMWIRFHSDSSGNGRGFEATYATKCGGIYQSANGTIQTPSFPDASLTPIDCEYEIRAPTTHAIQINFTSSNLGNDPPFVNCTENYVEMYSMPKTAQHNRRYCRIPEGRTFTGSGGSFKIRFVSSGSSKNKGFQASFQSFDVGCGGVLSGRRGLLRSPSHPLEYLDHMYCRWEIEVSANKVVKLTFNSFSIEEHRYCDYDYVSVYESYESENSSSGMLGKYCGMLTPPPLMSSTNTMVVLFVTDFSITSGGFEAVYEEVDQNIDCDRSYTADEGTITNLGYPNYINRQTECEYRIHVSRGYRIMLTVENMTLPCNYAYIEIRNGPNELSPSITGLTQSRLCDDSYVTSLRSQGNALYLKFKVARVPSLRRASARFSLNYTVLAESCGGVLDGIAGAVASPQYPLKSNQAYDCIYYISVADGNRASFYLTSFDLYNPIPNSCFHWASRLEIRDGPDASSPLLKRLCRSEDSNIGLIMGSKHRMTIRYVQMGQSTGSSGFLGHFSTLCTGIVLNTPMGRLASPGFGVATPADRECQWTIKVAPGNLIVAQVVYFKIDKGPPTPRVNANMSACDNGYLELNPREISVVTLNTQENTTDKTRFCDGVAVPSWIYSKSDQLTIKFASTRQTPENHFALEWSLTESSCGGKYFHDSTGILAVPKDSGDANADLHVCKYEITAPPGMQIQLTVSLLAINRHAPSGDCPAYPTFVSDQRSPYVPSSWMSSMGTLYSFNALNNASGAPQRSICSYIGNAADATMIMSASNEMYLELIYSKMRLATAQPTEGNASLIFMANYTFVQGGCGANLTDLRGYITSPRFPNPFLNGDECGWLITVPEGYLIKVQLMEFNIGTYVPDCEQLMPGMSVSSLVFYDGKNESAPVLARHCGSTMPAVSQISSTSNRMFIRFAGFSPDHRSTENTARGFKANYTTSCGSRLIARAHPGILHSMSMNSLRIPATVSAQCDWTIVAERPGDKVRFAVTFSDSPNWVTYNETTCHSFYTEVYDSETPDNTTLMDQFCGNVVPAPYVSTGSALFIRSVTPWYRYDPRFSAVYSSASSYCGGDYYAIEGSFSSPSYPSGYPANSECIWTILAGAGSFVLIDFSEFTLQDSEDCGQDFLEIRQDDRGGRLIGRYCGRTWPQMLRIEKKAWLRFRSDADGTASGFALGYKLSFGGTLTGDSGTIESPFYVQQRQWGRLEGVLPRTMPAAYVHPSERANLPPGTIWTIIVPNDRQVAIRFEEFMFPTVVRYGFRVPCEFDSALIVYDGVCRPDNTDESGVAGCVLQTRLCDVNIPSPQISTTNAMTLNMVLRPTGFSDSFPRFRILWNSVPATNASRYILPGGASECGTTELEAELDEQTLSSPGFPNGYAGNLDCTWKIGHPRNYSVRVNVTQMSLEPHPNCLYDFVDFTQSPVPGAGIPPPYESPYMRGPGRRYCGRFPPAPLTFDRQGPLRVKFRTDVSVNGSGFSLAYKLVCGGDFQISSDKQLLNSPNYPSQYPNQASCIWNVRAKRDRVLQVRFLSMETQPSDGPTCTKDYVEIFNGAGLGTPSFGRFCGTRKPDDTLESTSNSLRIVFQSDRTITAPGFQLIVEEKRYQCSDDQLLLTYESPSSVLTSPNYPQHYHHSMDCMWTVRSPSGTRIQFDVDRDSFQMERPADGRCLYDYLELRDGASLLAPLIGRYCGFDAPGSVFSTGNFLFVRFITDETAAFRGFSAAYKIAKCGGTIVAGQSGVITSPNYPNPYDNHLKCEWTVIAPEGHFINFSFADIMTIGAFDRNCTRGDYVDIRDKDAQGRSYGRFCYPSLITSEPKRTASNRMYVLFNSDVQLTARGFKLVFNVSLESCGGDLTDPVGVITSPGYPEAFPNNRRCTWKIKVAPEFAVNIQFEDFHIPETPARHTCPYDGVKLYDGPNTNSPVIASLCGSDLSGNRTFSSSANEMTMEFYSDVSVAGRGFKATYRGDQPARCGGRITQNQLRIPIDRSDSRSPVNNMYCHWVLVNPYGPGNSTIRVKFTNFNLTDTPDCGAERVVMYGSTGAVGGYDARQRVCGNKGTFVNVFWHGEVHIIYASSLSMGTFTFEPSFFACGGVRNEEIGAITSPNYPLPYEHLTICQWLITAPAGVYLRINVTDMNLEEGPECSYDNLTIQNGPYSSSPQIRKWCSSNLPPNREMSSDSRAVLVTFQSDISNSARGFRMEYRQVTDTCGSISHGRNGSIMSPNYPNQYPHNTLCQWEVAAPTGYHIELRFNAFEMQKAPNCTKDSLTVEERRIVNSDATLLPMEQWTQLGTPMCGYDTPNFTVSDSDYIRLSFKTDASSSGSGFNLTWTAICGSTFTSRSGRIKSPFYPDNYEDRMLCEYQIDPPSDGVYFIVLTFETFALEKARIGCHDYVEVTELNSSRIVGKFCGYEPPAPVSTKGPMKILFRTDESRVFKGFLASYTVSDCGGEVTLYSDVERQSARITSPSFPAKYHNNMNCIWKITAPENMILSFKFSNLTMEDHRLCNYDRVEIFNGENENASLISRNCGKVTPTRAFKSTKNKMLIRMYTDNSIVEVGGFVGDVTATLGPRAGCGGVINVNAKTTLQSPKTPDQLGYYPHMNCEWQVIAPPGRVIKAKIKRFVLEPPANEGCYDYLEIHDGYFESGPLIGSYCDTLSPWELVSSTNQLYLVFVTDQSVERGGFEIEFEPIASQCGGNLTASDSNRALNYVASVQEYNQRCQWRVTAGALDARVKIEIASMQYPDQGDNCDRSYLEFTDIPKTSASQSVRQCGTAGLPYISETSAVLITNVIEPGAASPVPSFNLTYRRFTSCNQTIELRTNDFGGRLTSPNYPNPYAHNTRCAMSLVAPRGYRIFIYFSDFRLENPRRGACNYDYVMIEEPSVSATPKYCGNTLPPSFESSSNVVNITFKTDSSVSSVGFDLTYSFAAQTERCGGVINAQSGTITSPSYPSYYPRDVDCIWKLRVHRGRSITIRILSLNFGAGARICTQSTDSLAIYRGDTISAVNLVNLFCTGENFPITVSVDSYSATIRFKSDSVQSLDPSATGFRLKFEQAMPAPQVAKK